ncbi:phosphomannomutase/phosphoglucomutase [Patescibacteria group bacterium]|nr:phosphomannomutase/phosphoglucomutase [Patescibacteria group bacterium]
MSIYDPSIFRAYDMRGVYPTQMNEKVAYAAGQGFVSVTGAKKVVVGRDVRSSGESMVESMIRGITEAGADVIEVGVISTEMLYFAAGRLECDGGLSITASHNPPQWNGIKCIGKGAIPLTKEGDLGKIYEFIQSNRKIEQFEKGHVEHIDLLPMYAQYLQKFVPENVLQLKLVANTNFGANGKVVDAATASLPLEIIRLNWQEDGTFPKGTPDPLLPKNRTEISQRIAAEQASFGAAWDADADRCFFYDEKGRFFHGYYITALLIKAFLEKEPGTPVISERRLVWANQDAAKAGGSELIFSRTGHGYIKKAMRDHQAIFAGEMSGHYYYRDFFFCDNGLITFLTVLNVFSREISAGRKVSDLLNYYLQKYPTMQNEANFISTEADRILEEASTRYADATQDKADGLSAAYPDWRFNLRKSDNEPLLRLNIEARTPDELDKRVAELKEFMTEQGATLRNDKE